MQFHAQELVMPSRYRGMGRPKVADGANDLHV
jgi:hypothetical protein